LVTSFAVRTKNIENKPVVNERGRASYSNSSHDIGVSKTPPDNLPVPKPHFAAVAIQPPPPKPAPAIVHSITTSEGIGSGGMMLAPAGLMRSRHSLLPVFREPRVSMAGGYQPFALPGGRRRGFGDKEKIRESDEDRSGSFGIGLTEKEIDERVGVPYFRLLDGTNVCGVDI
jgi:kinesin family protein 22